MAQVVWGGEGSGEGTRTRNARGEALLYLSAIAVFFMRYQRALDYFNDVLELYQTQGVSNPRTGVSIAPLRRTVFLLGSVVTALSILVVSLKQGAGLGKGPLPSLSLAVVALIHPRKTR